MYKNYSTKLKFIQALDKKDSPRKTLRGKQSK